MQSVSKVKEVLQCFQLVSGLKINFQKSRIYSHSKNQTLVEKFAGILGCKVGSWPMIYLRSQIGISSKKRSFWKPLINKFQEKLSSWKRECLNQAGRASLIKSTLDSLHVYWFNLHSIPTGVCDQLESVRRNFFWGSSTLLDAEKKRKMHLLAWDKICRHKNSGGIGFTSLKRINNVLLCKWFYKWHAERSRNWNKWIRSKYNCPVRVDIESNFKVNKVSGFIKDLITTQRNTWLGLQLVHKKCRWIVNNGDQALFWEDIWFQDQPLLIKFKKLFQLTVLKNQVVRNIIDLWSCYNHEGEVFWSRKLRPWEIEEVKYLDKIISSVKLNAKEDLLIWTPSKK